MKPRKIKDLPVKLQKLIELRTKEQNKVFSVEITVGDSFTWSLTKEGSQFWHRIHDSMIPIPEEFMDKTEKKTLKIKIKF